MAKLRLDGNLVNSDWSKTTWDMLDISNEKELEEFLSKNGLTLNSFKKLPIYQFNKDKVPFLKKI
jgi:hypothetical protein